MNIDEKLAVDDQLFSQSAELLKEANWPTPSWFVEKKVKRIQTYEDLFALQLRARYVELENEFRSVLGNYPGSDIVTAKRIYDLLHSARASLEQASEPLTVSCSLNLIERYMVWLYPPWAVTAKIKGLLFRLESLRISGRDFLIKQVTELSGSTADTDDPRLVRTRSVLDETIGSINTQIVEDRIGSSLQIRRLMVLRNWGILILLVFWFASPLAISLTDSVEWPSKTIIGSIGLSMSGWLPSWVNALAMMLLGAVGGFLSGLLQARCSKVALAEYLENMIRLELRPLIGALVALILYTFLSWEVLPGIKIENAGSYFVIAFLSGFSERYFLHLLKTETEELGEDDKGREARGEEEKGQRDEK